MKTILTLAIGFWLGRQIYLHHDKQTALKREARIKNRLTAFLKENGMSQTEIKASTEKIIGA